MTVLDGYRADLRAGLSGRAEAGLLRRLRTPQGIDLVSNDYLGLADHPYMAERMAKALPALGAGAGGSRLLRGHHPVFDRLEERLAAFSGTEGALLFGSGYAANVGLLQALVSREDVVFSDAHNHASIIDGVRLCGAQKRIYRHQDLGALARGLAAPRTGRAFVVTESVFSMDGDLTPLGEIVTLAETHGALVIVDEAHATGIYGPRGSGRVEDMGLRDRVLATVHTGGKALGSGGAWVAVPLEVRDVLINHARTFVFSTAPLPVLAAALEAGLDIVEREPERRADVRRKAALLRGELVAAGADVGRSASAIVPVIVGDNAAVLALQEGLQAAGFDARGVRPPTVPEGTARLRVTARHPVADRDLVRFAAEVRRLLARLRAA